ncbi:endonuclease/exonuclease/phosphatase family protein [Tabrizicola oligotrophica]|uniref:EEP domain-containing protein n=1 Tax=Tabrizicola oligotrophica TaxID=2710650 RepID=A0A6M0QWV7_9RHOB|nr:endonuclease/exonuclease/phosphatase family protein [Tabrizicola oligotrophica]NEY91940.1 EEP domain-containing protein [Tabrizicola oligotrophica]
MRLLSFNIQYGFGADGVYDLTRAAQVIAAADIACLQEVDRHWSRSGFDDQPARLEALLPDRYTVFGPGFDMDASRIEGGRVVNRRRQFGPMIVSRWKILWSRLHLLPLAAMIEPINTQTCALEACIAAPCGPLRVVSVHLAHVGVAERLAQIAALRAALPTVGPWSGTDDEPARNWTEGQDEPPCPAPMLWMGDFNCEPGSAEYRAIVGETPYHPGARYRGAMVDAAAGLGLHSHEKIIAGALRRRQLDHIFLDAALAPRLTRVWTETDCPASDHFPLWAVIDL